MVLKKIKYFLGLVILVTASCVEKGDETPPVVTAYLDGTFVEDSLFLTAGELPDLNFIISDNTGLSSARLFISKSSSALQSNCVLVDTFQLLTISDLSSSEYNLNPVIIFPDSLIGTYSLELDVLDEDGNSVEKKYTTLVQNISYPVLDSILVNGVESNCAALLTEGELSFSLNLQGTCVTDIETINLTVSDLEGQIESSDNFPINSTDLDSDFTIFLEGLGSYILKVKVTSVDGVSSWAHLDITVTE